MQVVDVVLPPKRLEEVEVGRRFLMYFVNDVASKRDEVIAPRKLLEKLRCFRKRSKSETKDLVWCRRNATGSLERKK